MKMLSLEKEVSENAYPGRGIVIGKSKDGTNSGNRLFYYGKKRRTAETGFL